jgi:oligopeptidase A
VSNPLLKDSSLPSFSEIKPEHVEPALDFVLTENRRRIASLLEGGVVVGPSFLSSMEEWDDELTKLWSPVSHLNSVKNSDALRDVYNSCLPKITEYSTEMGQNSLLYKAYQAVSLSVDDEQISSAQRKAVENALRDFKLSGITLNSEKQARFGTIKQRLAELSTQFSNNVMDATHGWSKHVSDEHQLSGIPENVLQGYRQAAQAKGLNGYMIGLDIPSYLPLMQYCESSELREEMYTAFNTRASDEGPCRGTWDNSGLMKEILKLRYELAQLLGFDNYAEYSVATKMAETPEHVENFLVDLAKQSLPVAKQDYRELAQFAHSEGVDGLSAWDIPYYSEKLRLHKYAISQEELRCYFPVDKVLEGMFAVVKRLYDIDIREESTETWHPDVRFFHISKDGAVIAKFYLDIFARDHKRGGAWMADCKVRRRLPNGELQLPVAFLTCNFGPATADAPALLTHAEVTTLFHEFGHGLHHMLTQIECAAVSGINGVAWDAVELPSQFLENWCWDKEAIPLISGHYQTGESLPEDLLEKLLAAKNFQSGMQMMRQLEFALFDLRMHLTYDEKAPRNIQTVLNAVREQVAVYPIPDVNRFQHSFSHIFAGGYAAGYYSYKWAEILSADAFSRFEEEGIFNADTGNSFLTEILEKGGSKSPMELFVNFRGREPNAEALLRHSGISSAGGLE